MLLKCHVFTIMRLKTPLVGSMTSLAKIQKRFKSAKEIADSLTKLSAITDFLLPGSGPILALIIKGVEGLSGIISGIHNEEIDKKEKFHILLVTFCHRAYL